MVSSDGKISRMICPILYTSFAPFWSVTWITCHPNWVGTTPIDPFFLKKQKFSKGFAIDPREKYPRSPPFSFATTSDENASLTDSNADGLPSRYANKLSAKTLASCGLRVTDASALVAPANGMRM